MYKSPANTLFVGKNVIYVPECHSTNSLATQLSQNSSISEGTVVITRNQTAGRGQRGNTWTAEPGQNLTLSVLLKPTALLLRHQFHLNIVVALAVYDMLNQRLKTIHSIKWPNDILVQNRKICGILIENQLKGQSIDKAVIGIGLNVNQSAFDLNTATSMAVEAKQSFELQEIFDALLASLEARYLQLRQNNYEVLKRDYLQHLYQRGELCKYEANGEVFTGEIVGVDEEGRLAINVENQMRYYRVKEVRYL